MGLSVVIGSWLLLTHLLEGSILRLADCEAQPWPRHASCCTDAIFTGILHTSQSCASWDSEWFLVKHLSMKISYMMLFTSYLASLFVILNVIFFVKAHFPLCKKQAFWGEVLAHPANALLLIRLLLTGIYTKDNSYWRKLFHCRLQHGDFKFLSYLVHLLAATL